MLFGWVKMSNHQKSKVSMVMPVYNNKDDINVMLESVYKQTWDNIELILVNDGSTDGTRSILADWEPKFVKRSYSVITIDQENQGISAAVHNGMLAMTGDYFCSADSDDYLYPDFVSTMADWLDKHPEYDYAACGFERIYGTKEYPIVRNADDAMPETLMSPNPAENILLYRVSLNSWNYMVRRSYLDRCKINENFLTEPRLHQEPSITIPLAMGQGRLKYFPQILYRHFLYDRRFDLEELNEKMPNYTENFTNLLRAAIRAFPTDNEAYKAKLLAICDFFRINTIYRYSRKFHDNPKAMKAFAIEMAELVNRRFTPSPNISAETVILTSPEPLFKSLEGCILEKRNESVMTKPENQRRERTIYCGALGEEATLYIPALVRTGMKPDVLWDVAARHNSVAYGMPVTKPDFTTLSKNDLVVIMPRIPEIVGEIIRNIQEAGTQNFFDNDSVTQYLCEYYYPTLYNCECRLVLGEQ
jgi:glycosyltransferase involved in cell wall biosynthesis